MKLFYITRVSIPSKAAQSVQIDAMCQAFGAIVTDFKLISTLNSENKDLNKSYSWQKVKLLTHLRYLEFVLKIFKIVLQEKPTHIFTRDIVVAFFCSFVSNTIIYEAHKEPRSTTAYWMLKYLRHKYNFRLITISNALKIYYLNNYKFQETKVFDCHDGVFLEKYNKYRDTPKDELRKELELPIDKTIVIHTGSLYIGRGAEHFETILTNFRELLFVQVGGTKQDIENYQKYYRNYQNIIFIGHQNSEALIKYQISADLLFYPMTKKTSTYWCCSPMKIFEYMATGIPILSSNIGSVSEVLNETNSIYFNPEDKQSIINGMKFFFENRDDTQKLAQKALADIKQKYTWEKRVEKIVGFIR